MKEEKYKAKYPRHIWIADPAYLEKNAIRNRRKRILNELLRMLQEGPERKWIGR